jgi:predicted ester cyclase
MSVTMPGNCGALARRWFEEVWNSRREEAVDALLAPDALAHTEGGDLRGPGAFKEMRAQLLGAFPDIRVTVEAVDLGFAASGRQVRFRGMSWMRFEGGKIAEGWDAWNMGALMELCRSPL